MKVNPDEAFRRFRTITQEPEWSGVRIKDIRTRPLYPGGRARLTMFEIAGDDSDDDARPHPRLQVEMPPAQDPEPPGVLFTPAAPPRTADELGTQIRAHMSQHARVLGATDLDLAQAPEGSPRYWQNSIRVQRIASFFTAVRDQLALWVQRGALTGAEPTAAERLMHELEDEAFAGITQFDDADTGTYHSFGHDKPFVHYLESLIESLPADGSEAFAMLSADAQSSIRRQRDQLYAHLDYLMRHKYANEVIDETNIERTLGGMLIDRQTRYIASEVSDASSLVPRYELLRIAPDAAHPHAGTWVYRDDRGRIRLQDGTVVEVDPRLVRSSPRTPEQLTFLRGPSDPRVRDNIRFDWDGNGWVKEGRIDWVSWAGHCDIKAIMEQLGITLSDNPALDEYRSDTGKVTSFDRGLLLEMVASVLELGSVYRRVDGTGYLQRGQHSFGGARNDSRPDRLQLTGMGEGKHFRWPLSGRQDAFRITSVAWQDPQGELERADMGTIFFHSLPDAAQVDFHPNPRFLKTVEGDYNLIDVSGAYLSAELVVEDFDEHSGYPRERREATVIDLRPEPDETRFFLGTHIDNAAARRLYRVYLDRSSGDKIIAEMYGYEHTGGKWTPRRLTDQTMVIPLAAPLACTLSREMKRDSPELYRSLLDVALEQAQNICADTDKQAAVWNGVVTRIETKKVAENRAARVERWHVDIKARFGRANLDYMVRRSPSGEPVEYCPSVSEDSHGNWPDFLWQDFPDIGSKGREGREWIVNNAMLERGIISMRHESGVAGGFYVYDDHIKNVFELIFTALAGYRYSMVHDNKRYAFESEASWRQAMAMLEERRKAISFTAS